MTLDCISKMEGMELEGMEIRGQDSPAIVIRVLRSRTFQVNHSCHSPVVPLRVRLREQARAHHSLRVIPQAEEVAMEAPKQSCGSVAKGKVSVENFRVAVEGRPLTIEFSEPANVQELSGSSSNSTAHENSNNEDGSSDSEDQAVQQDMSEEDLLEEEPRKSAKGIDKALKKEKDSLKKGSIQGSQSKGLRELVDEDHVGRIVRDYRRHMADFSKGRKKKIKQLILNKVWVRIYDDYLQAFPNSKFAKDSLKDHLRTALKDMSLGVNCTEDRKRAQPQDEDCLAALMRTEGWKTRNVLRTRNGAFNNSGSSADGTMFPGSVPSAGPQSAWHYLHRQQDFHHSIPKTTH